MACIDGGAIIVLTPTIWVTAGNLFFPCPSFSERICRTSPTCLKRFYFDPHSVRFEPFACLPERVVCFVCSLRFNITVAACEDSALRIRSNRTGMKVATVSLRKELPVCVLVTKSMGFIVCKTMQSFFVFNVNGLFAATTRCAAVIRNWTTFRTFEGFDYVAYDDGKGVIWFFEVAEPKKQWAIKNVPENIVAIKFDWRSDLFVVVTADARVTFHERSHAR
jgi:hypothetical protein